MHVALSAYSMVDGKVPCRRCTLLNEVGTPVCVACDYALDANPSVDLDEQIALQMQRREEEEASLVFVRQLEGEMPLHEAAYVSMAEENHSSAGGDEIFRGAEEQITKIWNHFYRRNVAEAGFLFVHRHDMLFCVANWLNWR